MRNIAPAEAKKRDRTLSATHEPPLATIKLFYFRVVEEENSQSTVGSGTRPKFAKCEISVELWTAGIIKLFVIWPRSAFALART